MGVKLGPWWLVSILEKTEFENLSISEEPVHVAGKVKKYWLPSSYQVAEPCHFSAAPIPEPSIFFTAPAPTYIASHQFLKINADGTLFFH